MSAERFSVNRQANGSGYHALLEIRLEMMKSFELESGVRLTLPSAIYSVSMSKNKSMRLILLSFC